MVECRCIIGSWWLYIFRVSGLGPRQSPTDTEDDPARYPIRKECSDNIIRML